MTDFTRIGAAVIGTGFIGTVHVEALRRMGVPVAEVLGSGATRGQRGGQSGGRLWVWREPMPVLTIFWAVLP